MNDLNIITVTELGAFAPEIDTSRYDAPTLSGMISAASNQVKEYLEYSPYAEDVVDEVRNGMVTSEGDLLIFPAKIPVISVAEINLYKGQTSVNLTLTAQDEPKYNIDYTRRHIRFPYDELTLQGTPIFTNFFSLRSVQFYTKISYRGGWEVSQIPQAIKQATVFFVKDILSGQYNQMGANRLRQGQVEFEYGNNQGMITESKLVRDAKRLLNPYRRMG